MKVYVANYADVSSIEAEQDYPSADWESVAAPQFASVSLELTDEWIKKIQELASNELIEIWDSGEVEEEDKLKLRWRRDTRKKDRPVVYQSRYERSYTAIDVRDGDSMIWLIIHSVEMGEVG